MRIFLDVDETLICNCRMDRLRPYAVELVRALRKARHEVFIWSLGGAEWARQAAQRLGIPATRAFSKCDEVGRIDWIVDDLPWTFHAMARHYEQPIAGSLVRPWCGDPYDTALLEVMDLLLRRRA